MNQKANGRPRSQDATREGWQIAFALTLFLALLVSLTPLYPVPMRNAVMGIFSFVCHQLPDRSPHIAGVQLAVGHRCMGIYWALPVAALVFGLSKWQIAVTGSRNISIVLIAGIPAGTDWLGDVIGLWTNTPVSRIITGAIFGLAAGYVLAGGISDIVREYRGEKKRPTDYSDQDRNHGVV